ncbi:uncharacterized protein CEXT_791401 [Caerostris extrusa]|uniref:Uncharacterized protein n=1 Tax=Caerostris extrusa TaxID=172846 RepID=A0AAV4M4Y9_CAEEX|nr:uncharacterized protein CEXT_791401 [Caerostris extrusa]
MIKVSIDSEDTYKVHMGYQTVSYNCSYIFIVKGKKMVYELIRMLLLDHVCYSSTVLRCLGNLERIGYSIKDHHGEQHREESGNGAGAVVGNYGFTDDRGIVRQVNYVADHAGFRAQVKTNEPGTANQKPCCCPHDLQRSLLQGAAQPYVSRPNAPLELSADPVLGLNAGYGYGVNGYGYGSGRNGLGYGYGFECSLWI